MNKTLAMTSLSKQSNNILAKTFAVFIVVFLLWKVIDYPGNSWGLSSTLFLIGVMLWKYPYIWLILVPGLLPILDFSTSTGRFFFLEFDYFFLLVLAINLWHRHFLNPVKYIAPPITLLLCLFLFFYLISLVAGLLPFQSIDANAFSNYYSHYNSLRISKGVIWAFLLLPFLSYHYHHSTQTKVFFAYGIMLGLTVIILTSIWERLIFTGLFNYTDNYRITSMFSSMHTGGGHIDIYLVLTIPFIVLMFHHSKAHLIRSTLGICLFLSSIYVLVVTFSRGPYISFCVQFLVFIVCALLVHKNQLFLNLKKMLLVPFFIIIISMFVTLVFKGGFIQQRFDQINTSFSVRMAHWKDATQMMNSDLFTSLFGMGLGTYPRTYNWMNSENVTPATYTFKTENKTPFIRLWGGDSMYIDQKVNTLPHSRYLLTLNFRSNLNNPTITIPLCEKGLLYSFNCRWTAINAKAKKNQWVHVEQIIETKSTGDDMGEFLGTLSRRPVKLSLFNDNTHAIIDIKEISLLNSSNIELIQNGDFSNGLDHWFFTTDNHLPWHSKNIFIQILFDQGWLGVLIFFCLLLYAFILQIKRLQRKDSFAPILLTSLTGLLVVGTVSSPFDVPRLTLLIFLILFLSIIDSNIIKSTNNY